ncbi:MAG: NADH:flavin oxidoreductase/NADH oxidase [Actinomycetota bacterium]
MRRGRVASAIVPTAPALFEPLRLRGVTIPNRVMVSPMSQYAAVDGVASDWQLVHLGRFALGGAGLVFVEATAVTPEGRRTPGDLGLWDDQQVEPLARIADFLERNGSVPGIQLGHAGRKASERRPWHVEAPLDDEDVRLRGEHPWESLAPSALPFDDGWPVPREMTVAEIGEMTAAFGAAAARAREAGLRVIDVYAGHGFLLHQFVSPIANQRTDQYGGSFEGRVRAVIETAEAIRREWPDELPLIFRLSVTDWLDDEGGWTVDETIELARLLREVGVDAIDCTSGGIGGGHRVRFPLGQGYQVPLAERVRREAGIATATVGMIWDPAFAEAIVADGRADLVALAREVLDDPNWALHAAADLGDAGDFSAWPVEAGWWLDKRHRAVTRLGLRS